MAAAAKDDHVLLAAFAEMGREEAAAELVRRYEPLVRAAALRQLGGLPAGHAQLVCFGRPLKPAGNFGLGLETNDAVDFAPRLKDEQRGNAADVEPSGGAGILIHIQLDKPHAPAHFSGEVIDNRGDHPAWAAPGGPHVHQHRHVRLLHLCAKRLVGDNDRSGLSQQGRFAAPADRRETVTYAIG